MSLASTRRQGQRHSMALGRRQSKGFANAQDIALQHRAMHERFPGFFCRTGSTGIVWHGTLQPRKVSPAYLVEIRYERNCAPRVFVTQPPLAGGCPHLYRDGSLCLYWPEERKWGPRVLVALTLVPWAALWLLYYELWLDTGKWLCPSSHVPEG